MIFLSIDSGASRTRGVLFTEDGVVRCYQETEAASLSRPDVDSPAILGRLIQELASQAELGLKEVDLVNVGVAGVSNLDARERLFRELDRLDLSDKAIVTSDVEAAYEVIWEDSQGVLVCVGTGAIGWARDEEGNTYRASGKGPQLGGDTGSGYWLGKTAIVHLIMNESVEGDDLVDLRHQVLKTYGVESVEEAARIAGDAKNMIASTARLSQVICELAEKGNDIALAMLQEGTQGLADELLPMMEEAGLRSDKIVIGINGGVIVNSGIYRQLLADALSYDLPEISWRLPEIDPVFGAGLIAARLNRITVNRDSLKKSWSEKYVLSQR